MLDLYQGYNEMSDYHMLILPTYTTLMKQCQGLAYHSPYYIDFYQVKCV